MKYTIQETVETVGWNHSVSTAPADMVKVAKDMADNGAVATFAQIKHDNTTPPSFTWCLLTVNPKGELMISRRNTEVTVPPAS